jgi:hypothetical protein
MIKFETIKLSEDRQLLLCFDDAHQTERIEVEVQKRARYPNGNWYWKWEFGMLLPESAIAELRNLFARWSTSLQKKRERRASGKDRDKTSNTV